jgi:predicted DNA-binding antitoxin AbrB/MazE fold protein
MQTITATFEDGVLKPTEPLNLPEHADVRLTIELLDEDEQKKRNQDTLAALEALWKISKNRGGHMTREQLNERR